MRSLCRMLGGFEALEDAYASAQEAVTLFRALGDKKMEAASHHKEHNKQPPQGSSMSPDIFVTWPLLSTNCVTPWTG